MDTLVTELVDHSRTVYHHSSSVEFYARGLHDNVELVDLFDAGHLRDVLGALDS